VIVGQSSVIEEVLIAMFARGHALLEGVPGLAKTLLISSLTRALHLSFKRIQITPDLMPSDVTGTEVIQEDRATGHRAFKFMHGPLFANVVLADEINRTPPKTQAALLEAMQERQVTVAVTPLAVAHGWITWLNMFRRAGSVSPFTVYGLSQLSSHLSAKVSGVEPEPLAISRMRCANVHTPPWVPAPVHGSHVRAGSSTTAGAVMNSDCPQPASVDTGVAGQMLTGCGRNLSNSVLSKAMP